MNLIFFFWLRIGVASDTRFLPGPLARTASLEFSVILGSWGCSSAQLLQRGVPSRGHSKKSLNPNPHFLILQDTGEEPGFGHRAAKFNFKLYVESSGAMALGAQSVFSSRVAPIK